MTKSSRENLMSATGRSLRAFTPPTWADRLMPALAALDNHGYSPLAIRGRSRVTYQNGLAVSGWFGSGYP